MEAVPPSTFLAKPHTTLLLDRKQMNTTKLPSIVLAVLGILFLLVASAFLLPDEKQTLFETLFLSGAILFAASGIVRAISDAGQNSKKEAGN